MILSEFSIFHSRPIAPTRRLALGDRSLPIDPAPGFGGILLGGVVANFVAEIDEELLEELPKLLVDLSTFNRVTQPRFRHRLQIDRVGMARSQHRLVQRAGTVPSDLPTFDFEFENAGTGEQQVLGAIYTAAAVTASSTVDKKLIFEVLTKAAAWRGPIGQSLISHLSGHGGGARLSVSALADPRSWALDLLSLKSNPTPKQISKRFRELVSAAHPDHGADEALAATRIADLTEARRILK